MTRGLLLVGNFLSAGAGSRGVSEELALRLSARGWHVVTTSSKRNRAHRLLDMTTTAWRHRREYAIAQVDVFSGPAFLWAEAVCGMLRTLNKPYVLTVHGGNLPGFARRWPGRVRRVLRSAVAVTAPSGYLLEELCSYRDDIQLLPNPIDLGAYCFRLREHPRPRLVWLRAFHSIYNPSLAPTALAMLVDDFPGIQLTMVGPDKGDGSYERTRQAAAELGVLDRIVFLGKVPKAEVPAALAIGDIFLNTTNVDNTPVSVLEAMASGLCTISTEVGGIPYLASHEKDALLVPPNDPGAMADAIRRVLTERGLAGSLSYHARIKAEQSDWSRVLPRWEALLTFAAAGGSR